MHAHWARYSRPVHREFSQVGLSVAGSRNCTKGISVTCSTPRILGSAVRLDFGFYRISSDTSLLEPSRNSSMAAVLGHLKVPVNQPNRADLCAPHVFGLLWYKLLYELL